MEAFPFDTAPRYLLRDGDGIYKSEKVQRRIESLTIDEVVTAPASTWSPEAVTRLRLPQNAACGFPALRSSGADSQHS